MSNKVFPQVSGVSAPKLRVVQCQCDENCKSEKYENRQWELRRWDGTVYARTWEWETAVMVALGWNKDQHERAERLKKLLRLEKLTTNSRYGKLQWPWSR